MRQGERALLASRRPDSPGAGQSLGQVGGAAARWALARAHGAAGRGDRSPLTFRTPRTPADGNREQERALGPLKRAPRGSRRAGLRGARRRSLLGLSPALFPGGHPSCARDGYGRAGTASGRRRVRRCSRTRSPAAPAAAATSASERRTPWAGPTALPACGTRSAPPRRASRRSATWSGTQAISTRSAVASGSGTCAASLTGISTLCASAARRRHAPSPAAPPRRRAARARRARRRSVKTGLHPRSTTDWPGATPAARSTGVARRCVPRRAGIERAVPVPCRALGRAPRAPRALRLQRCVLVLAPGSGAGARLPGSRPAPLRAGPR